MNDLIYQDMNLCEEQVVGLLIAYRDKYDPYAFINTSETAQLAVKGAIPLRTTIIELYASLDDLIEKCDFSDIQMAIINLSGQGFTVDEIAQVVKLPPSVVHGRFKTICKSIVKENLRQWRKVMFVSKLGLKTKTCSKCKEELPATHEFFSDLKQTPDGYHSQCRKCKN